MHGNRPLLIVFVLIVTALAGCISAEEEPPALDPGLEPTPTSETGSLKGQIVTGTLEEVKGAAVAVLQGGTVVADGFTNEKGNYVLNGIAPGEYRVQVSALCCKAALKSVTIEANKVAELNFQVEVLTQDDLELPYMVPKEWKGFITCGAGAGVPGVLNPRAAVCSIPGAIDESLEDPNEDFLHEFSINKGIKTFIVAMVWTPAGGVSGTTMNLLVENSDCDAVSCSYRYADLDGPSALVIRIDNGTITDDEHKFEKIESSRDLQYRVFAGRDYAALIYQQSFTVYQYEFYWEPAPEDFDPIPDA